MTLGMQRNSACATAQDRFGSKADVGPLLEASRECVPGSSSCEQNQIVTHACRRFETRVLSLEDLPNDG